MESHKRYPPTIRVKTDFRLARVKFDGEFTPFTNFETIFHNLEPHPALSSPETEADYLRLIAEGCLAVLLPTEDLASDCERTLVREILSTLVLRKALDLLSEPPMIYEILNNVPPPSTYSLTQIIKAQQTRARQTAPEPLSTRLWSLLSYFNPYSRPLLPPRPTSTRRHNTLTSLSLFPLLSELLSCTNHQTVLIRQISALLPLLIHGPIRIFLQKYLPPE
jgi:PXA domain